MTILRQNERMAHLGERFVALVLDSCSVGAPLNKTLHPEDHASTMGHQASDVREQYAEMNRD